jgi:hypothetical protein
MRRLCPFDDYHRQLVWLSVGCEAVAAEREAAGVETSQPCCEQSHDSAHLTADCHDSRDFEAECIRDVSTFRMAVAADRTKKQFAVGDTTDVSRVITRSFA